MATFFDALRYLDYLAEVKFILHLRLTSTRMPRKENKIVPISQVRNIEATCINSSLMFNPKILVLERFTHKYDTIYKPLNMPFKLQRFFQGPSQRTIILSANWSNFEMNVLSHLKPIQFPQWRGFKNHLRKTFHFRK